MLLSRPVGIKFGMLHRWGIREYRQAIDGGGKRDPESGEVVSKVGMPQIPTTDHILEAAEKFYDFVNGKPSK